MYGATAQEVQDQLLKARADKVAGLPVVVERQTVAQFLADWLENSVKPSVRPLTHEQYRQHVKLYLAPLLGHQRLAKLAPQHVRQFLNRKLQDGLSPRTVQLSLVILRRALGQAVKDGLVGRNVATLVDPPRWRRPEIMPWEPSEATRFLEAITGERLETAYLVALSLGLRRGEVLGLRWQDVDLAEKSITICQALARVGGRLRFIEPKSLQSRRTIPLHDGLVAALRAHRRRQLEQRLSAGSQWVDSGLLFTTGKGTPLEPRALNEDFDRIVAKVNLRRVRLHDLRHACASFLLAQGVHPRVVMEFLGHSQISLTMNTYSHVLPDAMREAIERMEVMLGRPAAAG
ncbi:MAG: tyrosine-type recombinase/integrase [Candidatus Binataceae bacterium]